MTLDLFDFGQGAAAIAEPTLIPVRAPRVAALCPASGNHGAALLIMDGSRLVDRETAATYLSRWRRFDRKRGAPRPVLVPFTGTPESEQAAKAARIAATWKAREAELVTIRIAVEGHGLNVSFLDGVPVRLVDARNVAAWSAYTAELDPKGTTVAGGAARYQESFGGAAKARKAAHRILAAMLDRGAHSAAAGMSRLGAGSTCACCARGLTDPESIARGIGPECWTHIGVRRWHAMATRSGQLAAIREVEA